VYKGQHRRIAGNSCQILSTAYRWKHAIWHHGETHGYGKNLNSRDNPQRSPKAFIKSYGTRSETKWRWAVCIIITNGLR